VLTAQTQNYFPHEDGYSWNYNWTSNLVSTNETSVINDVKKCSFNGEFIFPDGRVAQVMLISREASVNEIGYCRVEDDGVYFYGDVTSTTIESILVLPLPLETGKTWQRGMWGTLEVYGFETVTVPLGTFEAVKVGLTQGDFSFYEWYADGVGLLKSFMEVPFRSSTGDELGTMIITEELVNKNF